MDKELGALNVDFDLHHGYDFDGVIGNAAMVRSTKS